MEPRARAAILGIAAVVFLWTWQFLTVHYNYGGNWTALFRIRPGMPVPDFLKSERLYTFPGTEGYDGQVYHLIAHDPWMRRGSGDAITDAPFRYQRILVPALAWMLALGQDRSIDRAYVAVVLGFAFLGVYWLAFIATRVGRSPTWGLAFAVAPATIVSIDRMTVDIALAALTVGFAYYAGRTHFSWKILAILTCAVLTRETALPIVAGYSLYLLTRRRFLEALGAAATVLPAAAWFLYLSRHGTPSPALSYVDWIPLAGLAERWLHPVTYDLPALRDARDGPRLRCSGRHLIGSDSSRPHGAEAPVGRHSIRSLRLGDRCDFHTKPQRLGGCERIWTRPDATPASDGDSRLRARPRSHYFGRHTHQPRRLVAGRWNFSRAVHVNSLRAAAYGIAAVLALWSWQFLTVHYNYGRNWTALFCIAPHMPVPPFLRSEKLYIFQGSAGFDGQVFHLIAHDPWLRRGSAEAIVGPAFRYQRILVPALAWCLALGQDPWIHRAYYTVVLAFAFLGVYWMSLLAASRGISHAWGLAFLLAPACITSIDRMTADIAMAAFTAGFAFYVGQDSRWKVIAVLTCAALTKEPALPIIGGYTLYLITRKRFIDAVWAGASALPAIAWFFYLSRKLPAEPSALATLFTWIPGGGLVTALLHPGQLSTHAVQKCGGRDFRLRRPGRRHYRARLCSTAGAPTPLGFPDCRDLRAGGRPALFPRRGLLDRSLRVRPNPYSLSVANRVSESRRASLAFAAPDDAHRRSHQPEFVIASDWRYQGPATVINCRASVPRQRSRRPLPPPSAGLKSILD